MTLRINGEDHALPDGLTLPALLEHLHIPIPAALVELNGTALPRSEWPPSPLRDGDKLEILRISAGG